MDFSLTYAFGARGRRIRKISREARAFVGARFRNLDSGPLRDYLFAQYWAIDCMLFDVFYNDDPEHPFYAIHKKYANKLLDATESEYRHLARACALTLLAGSPISSATDKEEMDARLNALRVVTFIYDESSPRELWTYLVLQPDDSLIAPALCQEIAHVLQLAPHDEGAFASDWLSLVPRIIAVTNRFVTQADWSTSAAAMIESIDFGGTQH